MKNRDEGLLAIRPLIPSAIVNQMMRDEELFQNKTLRPIIKLQQDLLMEIFRHYISKHKNVFYELTVEKKTQYIDNAIHKDIKFRNSIKGIIIGHFTLKEHEHYMLMSSALNKRMMNLVKDRLLDNLLYFELKPLELTH